METLTTLRPETIEGLRDLIRVNHDSAKGFREAAEQIDDDSATEHFHALAAERQGFAKRLESFVEWNGDDDTPDGSFGAKMHRWWIQFRGTVQDGDVHAILSEAERGEDQIKAKYEEVLPQISGNPVNDVLLRQYGRVKVAHDRIRDLRDATA